MIKLNNFPPVREVNNPKWGKTLCDIDSHLPAGHPYSDSDLVTFAHETSHGIHAAARNKFQREYPSKINCFYCLNDQVCIIEEPKCTIRDIANTVPKEFRGDVYQTYLVNQAASWDSEPLYLLDEFNAYVNGSEVYRELSIKDRESTIWQSLEFVNYSLFLLKFVLESRRDYEYNQLSEFIKWNSERIMRLYHGEEGGKKYLDLLRSSDAGATLREFVIKHYGNTWFERVFIREMFW